jgi:hypothetical protein
MNLRAHDLLKPGPIFLVVWLVCYLIWALWIPREWDTAVRHFLLKNYLETQIYKSLGSYLDFLIASSTAFFIFGLALIVKASRRFKN